MLRLGAACVACVHRWIRSLCLFGITESPPFFLSRGVYDHLIIGVRVMCLVIAVWIRIMADPGWIRRPAVTVCHGLPILRLCAHRVAASTRERYLAVAVACLSRQHAILPLFADARLATNGIRVAICACL